MKVVFLRQPHKFIKNSDNLLENKLKQEILKIQERSKIGKQLKGKLKFLRVHRFVFSSTNYRIAYKVNEEILVVYIATRENFYKDLEKNI